MCDDFVSAMRKMIDTSVSERRSFDEPLVQEVIQHITFAQTKCEMFHGREEPLEVGSTQLSRKFQLLMNTIPMHLQMQCDV